MGLGYLALTKQIAAPHSYYRKRTTRITVYVRAVSSIGVRVVTTSHCNPSAGRFDIITHRVKESGFDPSSTVSSVGVREMVASFGHKKHSKYIITLG